MRLLFLVRRVGPYHNARYEAAGPLLELTVVETRPVTSEYPWTTKASARNYRIEVLGSPADPDVGLRGRELRDAMARVFASVRPEIVACTGWADPEYHVALSLCHRMGIPAIVMSDSTRADERRLWWKESLKGFLVRGFSAAIAAGSRSRDYLVRLGMPNEAVFEPCDVVDNMHFESPRVGGGLTNSASAPGNYFLCVSRYLPKKNLIRLVDAFASYRKTRGAHAWDLVILGSGELKGQLEAAIKVSGTADHVHLPGFVQYDDLPSYYSGAGALVLPSLSDQWGLAVNEAMASGIPVIVSDACGCAPDLVAGGECGFTFNPTDTEALAGLLARVSVLAREERERMGSSGRRRIAGYSPKRFAEALVAAAGHATLNRRRPTLGTRLILSASVSRN
jgi:glycosyltransferase involved in cell wall biosynthesis